MTIGQIANLNYASRYLGVNNAQVSKKLNQLSSGYRITSAAVDAAGLAVSEKMRAQINGLNMATQNATHAVSLAQTAEGGMDSITSTLQRMNELAVQASNGTYSDQDRALLNQEFQQLKDQINQVASSAHYNGINLLDGSYGGIKGADGLAALGISDITAGVGNTMEGMADFTIATDDMGVTTITAELGGETVTNTLAAGDTDTTFTFANGDTLTLDFASGVGGLTDGNISNVGISGDAAASYAHTVTTGDSTNAIFQVGANGFADSRIGFSISDMSSWGLGIADLDISSLSGANSAISAIQDAVNSVNLERANVGALTNRLDHTISNLTNTSLNLTAAESNIRDMDMALGIMELVQATIRQQASQAMAAQGMNMSRSYAMSFLFR